MSDTGVLAEYLARLPLGAVFEFRDHPSGWNLELIEDKDGIRRIAFIRPYPLIDDGYVRLATPPRE